MNRIYGYECRRLILNKFFIGISVLILVYGWQVIKNITILGVSFTAPFSAWSFGDYLSHMGVFLWIGILFLIGFYHTKAEKRRAVIFETAPVKPYVHELIRVGAILTVTVLLVIIICLPAVVFYGSVFDLYPEGMILCVTLFTLFPIAVFAIGSGKLLAHVGTPVLYIWMSVPFILKMIPLPESFGLLNGSFFTERPLSIEELDPEFSLTVGVIMVQSIVFILGVLMIFFKNKRKR
ncbi:MAG: hypothetical protein K6G24_07270 [Lachnospiraceae bacterium]|nr:hypothetical protein [Lachnospiraceae bacterium]